MEMIEFAKDMTPMELLALSGRMKDSGREEIETNNPMIDSRATSGAELVLERHDHESAAELVNLLDESLDFTRGSASREGDTNQTDSTSENEFDGDDENTANDASEEKSARLDSLEPGVGNELISCDPVLENGEANGPTDSQSDNSIDGIDKNDELCMPEAAAPQLSSEIPKFSSEDNDKVVVPEQTNNNTLTNEISLETEPETLSSTMNQYDNSFDADAVGEEEDGKGEASADVVQTEDALDENESAVPDQTAPPEESTHGEATKPPGSPEKPLISRTDDISGSEEGRHYIDADTTAPTPEIAADVPATIDNVPHVLGMLQTALRGPEDDHPVSETDDPQATHSSRNTFEESSLSDVGQELDLASHLIEECQAVLDDICSVVAEAIQAALGLKNSLVSEIATEEVLETAEAVRLEYHHSTWDYAKIASTLLVFLFGLSRLVKVFYPYLVNQPREELGDNWHPVSSVLAAMGLPTDYLYIMLDPMCKTLLLAVKLCSRSNQESQDPGDLAVFPKVTVVCDREDVLQSSVDSFGEKLVDGVKVEEGEGKGPLKEWFTLVGTQLASKWKQIPISKVLAEADSTQLEWETSEGETIRRVVNKSVENGVFLLDRSVPSHSFATSQLRISQPIAAIFEYVQGSESYWLNENARDSSETRNILVFVGWFLASAITHFSSIQLRIHPLFFRLLLNPQHCVALEEIQSFDPQLFKSLSGMKDMKPSDFAQLLKFEGADESLTVEAYTSNVLEEKFGPASGIGWQLHSVRRGFTRVIGLDQLERVGITEADLVESICGSSDGPGDDFIVNEVFRVAADTDFTNCLPLWNAFWQTVNGFELQLKRKFIRFVTGVDTLPLTGTEFLRIEMPFTAISSEDHKKCLQMLPQAHTCDNMLELPNYWKALCWREQHDEHEANSKLEEELALLISKKLRDAVEYSNGYGSTARQQFEDQLAKEESYDSLGLPALSEPVDDSPPSHQRSDHDEAELEEADEPETKPAESFAVAVSPRPEESYEDDYDDWEEESMA
ncbi:HECT domain [Phytophthora cactorum]|nr:HECT domain [Phytophthora cactorum]